MVESWPTVDSMLSTVDNVVTRNDINSTLIVLV